MTAPSEGSSQTRPAESVWGYPRPPLVVPDDRQVVVRRDGEIIAESSRACRVLETSHPPVFYIPPPDVDMARLIPNSRHTFCEFKGTAVYWDLSGVSPLKQVAWSYPDPSRGYESLVDLIAFYPSKLRCSVDGEEVVPQAGGFYGGWVTSEIVGPFKGGPGTSGW